MTLKVPKAGEQIYVMGYPMSSILGRYNPSISQGIVSKTSGFGEMAGEFQITAKMNKGNSGGPIFNDKGEIIGISVGKLNKTEVLNKDGFIPEDVNVGISGQVLTNFLNMPVKANINEVKDIMHQNYINICDHLLYLSLVNKLLIFLIILFPTFSNAEWINSEGSEYIDRKTTIDEACKNATHESQTKRFIKSKFRTFTIKPDTNLFRK